MSNSLQLTKLTGANDIRGFADHALNPVIRMNATKKGVAINYYDKEIGQEVGVNLTPEEAELFIEEIRRMLNESKELYR